MAKSENMKPGCAVAFCALAFLAGCGFLVLFLSQLILPEWRANNSFVENTCVVLDKRIIEEAGEDGPAYRPEFLIRHTVNGLDHEVWAYDVGHRSSSNRQRKEKILQQFVVGKQYPCWCDPDDPGRVVLVRGYSWLMYLFVLIPLAFIILGGAGMRYNWVRRGKSPEQLASCGEPEGTQIANLYPYVPDINLERHPGSTLAFRLPLGSSPGCALLGIVFFTLFWNGITSIFVFFAIASHLHGEPQWFLNCFIMPFVLIGLVLILGVFRELLLMIGTRPATVEISSHPLTPGETCRLHVAQHGLLRLSGCRVLVVCEEVAKFTEGDSSRTDKKRTHEVELLRQDEPHAYQDEYQIPAGAMHSFKASNNEVQWKVLVLGKAAGWLKIAWEFPFVVRPPTAPRKIR
jgi:hypothetical protein